MNQNSRNFDIGGTTPGARNIISGNEGHGIRIDEDPMVDNPRIKIQANSIFNNNGLGINFGSRNDFLTLNSVSTSDSTTIQGTLNNTLTASFRIEFFSNSQCDPSGYGEGKTFIGSTSVTTDSSGDASFSATLSATVSSDRFITATATDSGGSTSEFSKCEPVSSMDPDIDGDGLLNTWEREGYDADGDGTIDIDLPAMGADPSCKDVFIELDWMANEEHSHRPNDTILGTIKEIFASAPTSNPASCTRGSNGIALHIDTGQLGGGGLVSLPDGSTHKKFLAFDCSGKPSPCIDFDRWS